MAEHHPSPSPLRFLSSFAGVALAALVAACGGAADAPDEPSVEDELRTSYADLLETLPEGDLERWITVRAALVAGFDRICGDTICSGDYSNLTTVRLVCSSTTKARKLKACTWLLGGSLDHVDGGTGKIVTAARAFECPVPVASTAKQMLDVLAPAGDDALHTPLPGTGRSFYDALVDCFEGVRGEPPPPSAGDFYVDLTDALWSEDADAAVAWLETKRRLATRFDEACGDSFCEGEWPHFAPLRFVCSMNRNSRRVSRCSWSFVAAETSVGPAGVIVARTTTKRCNVEIGAPDHELREALAADDPLHVLLPRRSTTIYDALIGCL